MTCLTSYRSRSNQTWAPSVAAPRVSASAVAAEEIPASAVRAAKSGASAVGLIATATRARASEVVAFEDLVCRPRLARVDQHLDQVGQPGGVTVCLGVRMGVFPEKVHCCRAAAAPEVLELSGSARGIGREDELRCHPRHLMAGDGRHEPAAPGDPPCQGDRPDEQAGRTSRPKYSSRWRYRSSSSAIAGKASTKRNICVRSPGSPSPGA